MTDNLSRTLHDTAKALNVSKTLKSMRNKVACSNLWETITKLARGIPDLDEPVLPRRKNGHNYNKLVVLEGVVYNAPAVHPATGEDHNTINHYFSALKSISGLTMRFGEEIQYTKYGCTGELKNISLVSSTD